MAEIFRPHEILAVLAAHEVRYVLIGGLAATFHGSPHLTLDVDITPERSEENLARLSSALRQLGARVRVAGEEPLPFSHDATSLAAVGVWNLRTSSGDLDISFVPTGTRGYEDLARRAVKLTVDDLTVVVAALEDVVRSKSAAGRAKDELTLPTLRELLARRSSRPAADREDKQA